MTQEGTTYPDIVLIPIIAELFDTSIDNLMGYAKECSTEEREAFYTEVKSIEFLEKSYVIGKCCRNIQTTPVCNLALQVSYINLLENEIIRMPSRNLGYSVTESYIVIFLTCNAEQNVYLHCFLQRMGMWKMP